jgi:hypothetical protein
MALARYYLHEATLIMKSKDTSEQLPASFPSISNEPFRFLYFNPDAAFSSTRIISTLLRWQCVFQQDEVSQKEWGIMLQEELNMKFFF